VTLLQAYDLFKNAPKAKRLADKAVALGMALENTLKQGAI
jgi:hypothetical protein